MNNEEFEREARNVKIGICACGGDFTCTPHRAIAALCARVDTEARREQRETDAKKVCGFCERGVSVQFESGVWRHRLQGETPWVACRANAIRNGEQPK